jgi:hypothetical protein
VTRKIRTEVQLASGRWIMLEAEVFVTCRDRDGCDTTYEIEWMGEAGRDDALGWDALAPASATKLDRECQELADEVAPLAAQEHLEGLADFYHDRMKEE